MQCRNPFDRKAGERFLLPRLCFFARLLRLHSFAQCGRSVGGVANGGGNLNRTVAHRGFGGQDFVLHGLRRDVCKVLVRHDADRRLP